MVPAVGPQARTCLLLLAAVAVLWMATRPYSGVYHDARLYTLQALSAADPSRFADDLFLRFGSQDRFTIFSRLYGPVLGWAGVSLGAILLTLLAHATWLCGAYCLAKALLGDPVRALAAVAGLVALPSTYGAGFTFSYGEPFLTPRLFAEALTMLALGCAVRGSPGPAATALVAAGAFHPVMAVPGASAFFFYKAFGNRAWWAAAACVGVGAGGLAALGVEPFGRLGVRFDPLWFEVVRHRAAVVFVGSWSLIDCSVLAGQAALAVLALAVPGAEIRRLLAAILLTAASGLVLTAVGADLARNQLLTNIQPWRATWLLGVTAHLLAVPLLLEFAGEAGLARPVARAAVYGGVAFLFLARLLPEVYLWSALLLASAVVLVRRRGTAEPLEPVLLRVLAVGAAALMVVSVVPLGFAAKAAMEAWPGGYWARLCAFGLCISGLGLVAAAGLRPGPSAGRGATGPFSAAAFLLLCAALGWDQRTAWTKFVEAPGPPPDGLAAFVPDGATVYWDGGLDLLWLRLKRSSYHSCAQGAGVIFFRETALAYRHRGESFRFEAKRSDLCLSGSADRWDAATSAELRRACVREPELDRIVLPYPVQGVPRLEWAPPVKLQVVRHVGGELGVREFDRFYAYPCDALR